MTEILILHRAPLPPRSRAHFRYFSLGWLCIGSWLKRPQDGWLKNLASALTLKHRRSRLQS
jgi:hypothetical protein